MRTTALGELVPGIEIQAQVIETIFEGRFLRRPTWLKWAEIAFITTFGLLIIWYVPRTDSRIAAFMRAVPKGSAILGILLNLLILASGLLFFKYLGLLVDAASIFIILSAVMGCFFSTRCSTTTYKPSRNRRTDRCVKMTTATPAKCPALG
jgi:adenylate cyclase